MLGLAAIELLYFIVASVGIHLNLCVKHVAVAKPGMF